MQIRRGSFVQRYKYMRICLWIALRVRDFRMMDLRVNGFWKRAVWFLRKGFMGFGKGLCGFWKRDLREAGLFLGTEDTALDNASLSHGVRKRYRAYKYLRIYLWSALRSRDFERGLWAKEWSVFSNRERWGVNVYYYLDVPYIARIRKATSELFEPDAD